MIKIGEYIEMAVEWLTEHGASFFDLLSLGVEGVIDGILCILLEIPFYITIVTLTFLALYKSGRETGGFTLLGLSLVYGMVFLMFSLTMSGFSRTNFISNMISSSA